MGEEGPPHPVPRPRARGQVSRGIPRPALDHPRLQRRRLSDGRPGGRRGPLALPHRLGSEGDPPRAHREGQDLPFLLPHRQGPGPEHAHAQKDAGPGLHRHRLREDGRRQGPACPLFRQLCRPCRHDRHPLDARTTARGRRNAQSLHRPPSDPSLSKPGRGQGGGRKALLDADPAGAAARVGPHRLRLLRLRPRLPGGPGDLRHPARRNRPSR